MNKHHEITSPLTYEQKNIWQLHIDNPGIPLFNANYLFHIKSGFECDYFVQALRLVVARHGGLSSRFGGNTEHAMQYGPSETEDKISDFVYLFEKAENFKEAHDIIKMRSVVPFRLNLASPIRADIVPMANDAFLINITVHQIVCDCWSASLFFEELSSYYNSLCNDKETVVADNAISYMSFSLWQKQHQEKAKSNMSYWLTYLQGVDSHLDLSKYKDPSDASPFSGGVAIKNLTGTIHSQACALAKNYAVTPYAIYMTLFAAFLQHCTQQNDFCLSYPSSNRNMPESDEILGLFTRLLPVRFTFGAESTLKEMVAKAYEALLDNSEHDLCCMADIVKEAGLISDINPFGLFKIVFGQIGRVNNGLDLKSASIEQLPVHTGYTKTDLLIMLDLHSIQPVVFIEFSSKNFSDESISTLWQDFSHFLQSVLNNNLETSNEAEGTESAAIIA
ncbi:condensation domain-containing protein [Winslowiella toletana]|uniref:condensation domain-containing protein n=1 Tax=Winslowiella toletana TaxID=92490 RepID=UPI0028BDA7C9|nr:condensation domain-containing protein [Winslowiella toletana]WNN42508.1 condensation domain-containing protein [Winslowiella toletana]